MSTVQLRWRIEVMPFIVSSFELFPCGALGFPPLPPRPVTPAGVKGSLNSQFGCVAPNTELSAGGCGALLLAGMGARSSRSNRRKMYFPTAIENVPSSAAWGGSGLALFERSEFSQTPPHASSAGNRAAARSQAGLSFAYFSLAKQRKVSRPPGRDPASYESQSPRPPGQDRLAT
jgi:hypothetical protein